MLESILIKNVKLYTPYQGKLQALQGDLLIENGYITEIGPNITKSAQLILEEKGLSLLPGFVDSHVHFRNPGLSHKESWETAGKAALSGGVTTACDMPNTNPATTTQDLLDKKLAQAKEECPIDVFGYIGATTDNLDELQKATQAVGIKIFVGSSTGNMLVDDQDSLEAIFAQTKGLICVHAEDESMVQENAKRYQGSTDVEDHMRIRNPKAALKATQRVVDLALRHQRRTHILHITSKDEVAYLASLDKNPYITAEVCIPHLFCLAPDIYESYGTFAQVNPPIRDKTHFDALNYALTSGLFSQVSTDHAPHQKEEKQQSFGKAPSGMPSIQFAAPLLLDRALTGHYSIEQVINWYARIPATLIQKPDRGALSQGFLADMVLFDEKGITELSKEPIHSKAKWHVFEDHKLTGRIIGTIKAGQLLFRESEFLI